MDRSRTPGSLGISFGVRYLLARLGAPSLSIDRLFSVVGAAAAITSITDAPATPEANLHDFMEHHRLPSWVRWQQLKRSRACYTLHFFIDNDTVLSFIIETSPDNQVPCGAVTELQCAAVRHQLVALQEAVHRLKHALELQTRLLGRWVEKMARSCCCRWLSCPIALLRSTRRRAGANMTRLGDPHAELLIKDSLIRVLVTEYRIEQFCCRCTAAATVRGDARMVAADASLARMDCQKHACRVSRQLALPARLQHSPSCART